MLAWRLKPEQLSKSSCRAHQLGPSTGTWEHPGMCEHPLKHLRLMRELDLGELASRTGNFWLEWITGM